MRPLPPGQHSLASWGGSWTDACLKVELPRGFSPYKNWGLFQYYLFIGLKVVSGKGAELQRDKHHGNTQRARALDPSRQWDCGSALMRDVNRFNAPGRSHRFTCSTCRVQQYPEAQSNVCLSPFLFSAVELLHPPFSQVLRLEQQLDVETNRILATKAWKYGSTLSC